MSPEETSQPVTIEQLQGRIRSLEKQLEAALAENERLRKELEEALRSTKRQAAPFSRRKRKKKPKKPGRKRGSEYGKHFSRPVPDKVDADIPVPLPKQCRCGGPAIHDQTLEQYQEDIVRKTVVRCFHVEIGHCGRCGERIQGRHPLQTSDALGAAQVQIGPEALTLSTHLNKEMGLSYERAARVLQLGYGFQLSRSGICRAVLRLGDKAAPTYEELRVAIRRSDRAWMDETGWRVDAMLQWLWVSMSPEVTVYDILPGRGFEQAASILGKDWEGWLHHDGWKPYYQFQKAFHQSCLNHLMTRCKDLIETVSPAASKFPSAMLEVFERALALRDRYALGDISRHGLRTATGQLESRITDLVWTPWRTPANRRLAKHLRHEEPWLLTFLHCPGVDATNNAAERALRPAVINRKTWGGNRAENGARAQRTLMSVLRTCHQQGKDSFDRIVALWRSPVPMTMDIIPAGASP